MTLSLLRRCSLPWMACKVIALSVLASLPLAAAHGQATRNVSVSPTRVIFEGRTRSVEVLLLNRGTSVATYRIFFKNMRMNEDGSLQDVEEPEPGQLFADKYIRYSPRQITIEAGRSQTVRLLVRKPKELAPGEYRSHLVFRSVPPAAAGESIETEGLEEGEIRVRMIPIFAISIPVFILHGDLSASLALSDLRLAPSENGSGPPVLFARLDRSGNRSIGGAVVAMFKPDGGEEVEVGRLGGVAVYTPVATRTFRLPLNPPEGVKLEHGRLRVTLREQEAAGGAIMDEAEIDLP